MSTRFPEKEPEGRPELDLFAGGGEMGVLMRQVDWPSTPLGPVHTWPQYLRPALSICIGSRFPIAIYWGPSLALLYNDAWRPILGEKHPWALGRPAREVWPEIWDTIGPMFQQVMTTGEATYSEDSLLLMHRHGYTEECYFNFTFSPIRGDAGHVEGVFNAVIETTYRVLAERRSRLLRDLGEHIALASTTEDVARRAVESLSKGPADAPFCLLYLVERDGKHARLAACAGVEAGGAHAPSAIALENEDGSVWPVARAHQSQRVEVVNDLVSRFGIPLHAGPWPEPESAALIAPITMPSGERPSAFLIVGANPRRAVDEPYVQFLQQAASQLAASFASVRRREELAEIDRAKTTFFSNVSHEFRTPLTLMLGPTEEALKSASPRLEGEDLALLHRNELRLLKLVNSLLDFSRIEAGRTDAAYEPTDVSALTADLASSFRSAIEKVGLTLVVDCPRLPETFHIDRDMWEKIVLNLLSNAFKFTFEGTIAVRLREVQGGAELEVADTGIGIGAQDLPRIFERFHRIEGAHSRSHEGSGIGLALVQELVRLHGGELRVESQHGEGSRFFVRIPSGTAHLPNERLRASRTLQRTATGAGAYVEEALRWVSGAEAEAAAPFVTAPVESAARERILVVDDNADMRDYVSRLLRERWHVEATNDGLLALESIRRNPPDLVLTDVMMPGLDGFGLLRALRSDASTRAIPVVMLSARAGEEATSDGLKSGADDYLVKPFTARELFVRIAAKLTAVKAAREASAQRANLYRAFMQAPFPVAIFRGPEHVIELANDACLGAWGEGPSVIGRPLLEARPHIRNQPFPELMNEVYRTGTTHQGREQLARLPTGTAGAPESRYYDFVYAPLFDARGDVEGIMMCAFDVSDRVRAQILIKDLAEREGAARVNAEEANRAKDDFLAMLGHELRNPLSPIVTAIHLLKLRGGEGAAREVSVIERQTEHLTRLVDDLLDVSRITRGKVTLNRESVEVADIVAAAIETASPTIENGRHQLITKVPTHGMVVDVDRVRMSQVIANLLTNAAKYTLPGGRITISAVREGPDVVIHVEDSGVGISADLLPRVFDLFVQARQTLARAQGGLGLGLAIVKSLVSMHGGSVSATSEGLGRGSTFSVRLPSIEAGATKREASAPPRAPVELRRAHVLVVDDNVDGAEMLAEALRAFGYRTAVAHDGPEALEVAAEFGPQIALLDIGLPVMDGYELAGRLREQRPDLMLVAITGYGQDSDRARARDAGFDDHLTKPIDLEKLGRVLELRSRPS